MSRLAETRVVVDRGSSSDVVLSLPPMSTGRQGRRSGRTTHRSGGHTRRSRSIRLGNFATDGSIQFARRESERRNQ